MTTSTRSICVIPARGGSKRLPGKNILDFAGKPMIAHSIAAVKESGCFERVVVSSDDREILAVAAEWGAETDERSPSLAQDQTPICDVLVDFLEREEAAGRDYDVIGCQFAAAPLCRAEDVAAVCGLLEPGNCDFAIATTEYDLPPHQALKLESDGRLAPMWPDLVDKQDDQVGQLVVDNGSAYAAYVPQFRRQTHFFGSPLKGYLMPRERSVDLNSLVDLEMAKRLYEVLNA